MKTPGRVTCSRKPRISAGMSPIHSGYTKTRWSACWIASCTAASCGGGEPCHHSDGLVSSGKLIRAGSTTSTSCPAARAPSTYAWASAWHRWGRWQSG
ncbi:conserved hypothetical protein [Ricinus communis]|uniref:Uncharacterized protein n=1 Tax=Ricinus communis TaxID=3988 RepID=B9TLE3_RICCO|nr:conserved hypothetical protein [Ricinus communis]